MRAWLITRISSCARGPVAGNDVGLEPLDVYDHRTKAFSLIELVIVVVIIGIIGAIAVPRLSRGSQGAAVSALVGDLAVLNKALDHYAAEHGGDYPDPDKVVSQLTGKTLYNGEIYSNQSGEVIYGPYLRAVPAIPIGPMKGSEGIAANHGDGVGWLYYQSEGRIRPNLTGSGGDADEDLVDTVINASGIKRIELVKGL